MLTQYLFGPSQAINFCDNAPFVRQLEVVALNLVLELAYLRVHLWLGGVDDAAAQPAHLFPLLLDLLVDSVEFLVDGRLLRVELVPLMLGVGQVFPG